MLRIQNRRGWRDTQYLSQTSKSTFSDSPKKVKFSFVNKDDTEVQVEGLEGESILKIAHDN